VYSSGTGGGEPATTLGRSECFGVASRCSRRARNLRRTLGRPGLPNRVPLPLRRGGRAVECGGLENRFGLLGPTRVQIPPPPLTEPNPASDAGFRRGQAESLSHGKRREQPAERKVKPADDRVTIARQAPRRTCIDAPMRANDATMPANPGARAHPRKKRNSRYEGIVLRHARACAIRKGGRNCSCTPTYQAQVWSASDRKTIRKTFPSPRATSNRGGFEQVRLQAVPRLPFTTSRQPALTQSNGWHRRTVAERLPRPGPR
jgi:hypothetical protein